LISYQSAFEYLRDHRPDHPVVACRPFAAKRAANWFMTHFSGDVLYALKANVDPVIVESLIAGGIRHFDVASLTEIEFLSQYEGITSHFMHPVKPRSAIRKAYFEYGVKSFCLDSTEELTKILQETDNGDDLDLFVRIKCTGEGSHIALDHKFGIEDKEAIALLVEARQKAASLGVAFHIGSQAMNAGAFGDAMRRVGEMVVSSGVILDRIDVGGGFPAHYPGLENIELKTYLTEIHSHFDQMPLPENCKLMCEPGRALVAESSSLILKVLGRKGDALYVNDGAYGALYDAAHLGFRYPVRFLGEGVYDPNILKPFKLYGPTCDSDDFMEGPFYLPENIAEGDYIEIGQTGAYGEVMRSDFNGFGSVEKIILEDEPLMGQFSDLTVHSTQCEPGRSEEEA